MLAKHVLQQLSCHFWPPRQAASTETTLFCAFILWISAKSTTNSLLHCCVVRKSWAIVRLSPVCGLFSRGVCSSLFFPLKGKGMPTCRYVHVYVHVLWVRIHTRPVCAQTADFPKHTTLWPQNALKLSTPSLSHRAFITTHTHTLTSLSLSWTHTNTCYSRAMDSTAAVSLAFASTHGHKLVFLRDNHCECGWLTWLMATKHSEGNSLLWLEFCPSLHLP